MAKQWLEPEGLTLIEGWARKGLTNEQIAQNMGIARQTLQKWLNDYQDISDTLKKGKEVVDFEVESKLFRNAMGYHYEEEKTFIEEVDGKLKKRKEIYKRYARPDTTAQIFWLKNRLPKDWRDRITQSFDEEELTKVDQLLNEIEKI